MYIVKCSVDAEAMASAARKCEVDPLVSVWVGVNVVMWMYSLKTTQSGDFPEYKSNFLFIT